MPVAVEVTRGATQRRTVVVQEAQRHGNVADDHAGLLLREHLLPVYVRKQVPALDLLKHKEEVSRGLVERPELQHIGVALAQLQHLHLTKYLV